jgi:hypothetical protein
MPLAREPSWTPETDSRGIPMRLFPAVLLTLLLPASADASSARDLSTSTGCAARLMTCASIQVQYLRTGLMSPSVLTIGSNSPHQGQAGLTGFRFQRLAGETLTGGSGPAEILAIVWGDDGQPRECQHDGHDCRPVERPITTPEPVTMTLVATGLISLLGANRWRRRGQQQMPDR